MFSKHQESAKHIDANKTKHSALKIIHEKGNIKDQLKRGFMNKKAKEEENKSVITVFREKQLFRHCWNSQRHRRQRNRQFS